MLNETWWVTENVTGLFNIFNVKTCWVKHVEDHPFLYIEMDKHNFMLQLNKLFNSLNFVFISSSSRRMLPDCWHTHTHTHTDTHRHTNTLLTVSLLVLIVKPDDTNLQLSHEASQQIWLVKSDYWSNQWSIRKTPDEHWWSLLI